MKRKYRYQDLSTSDLPHTRKREFFDIISHRHDVLFKNALYLFVGFLPFIAVLLLSSFATNSLFARYQEETINRWDYYQGLFVAALVRDCGLLISSLIFAVVLSGEMRIYRRLCYQEGIQYYGDFGRGIKENYGQCALCLVLVFLLFLLSDLSYQTLGPDALTYQKVLRSIPLGFFAILILPWSEMTLIVIPIYQDGFLKKAKTSFLLFGRSWWQMELLNLAFLAPLLLFLIPSSLLYYLVFVLYPLVYLPFFLLAGTLLGDFILDTYINQDNFPMLYHKGLWRKEEKEL